MRNLKKILALVLAVVMSLSLMATAGAAGSTAETINEDYKTATDVLQALKVFKGYEDGTFKPQQSITRAEVATILYRIVTGDVESARSDIYTDMQSTKFTDLAGATWATGYINYCANAKLIVGVGGNKFMPSANITGYATLAMILRALGYDKNGEFQGSGWEIRTASTARELGILKNVSQDALGSAASREMVAELLFRAMLCDKVQYNALIQDYTKTGTTLGYEVFTLEEVEGVVVANEYADLRRDANGKGTNKTAAAGTTVLRNDDGKDYTVTTASGLDDLGETRVAYTVENGKRATYDLRNVKLDNPDKDDIVYDGGEEFSSIASKISGNEAEHYVNFGEDFSDVTTTIKVTYQARMISRRVSALSAEEARKAFVDLYNLTGLQGTNLSADLPNHLIATPTYLGSGSYDIVYIPAIGDIARSFTSDGHTYSIVNITENGAQVPYYKVEIAPGFVFTSFDESMVTAIFNRADRLPDGAVVGALVVTGEVFRGTQSVYDYSDWRSYEEFRADCLKESEENTQVTSNGKGYWLKIIDNDKDGVTDWVFQTRYTVASVSSVKDGVPTLEAESTWGSPDGMNVLSRASSTTDESGDLAVGDVVYYAVIDGVARAWKADVVEVRANTINRNNKTVTTSDGTVYEESANHEHSTRSDIASHVVNMSGTTNYSLYLDKYGYLAAFSQNIAGKFVLLVNGWARNVINGTEYAVTAWDSETRGYNVYNVTSGGGLFIDTNASANSWNRISHFHDLNCDLVGGVDTTQDVLSMVAYMETDGENATLIPVDTIYDVEDQNNRGYFMIDMGTVIPDSNLRNGTMYRTTTSAFQPYDRAGAAGGVRVRALADTTYYYVYNNQRTTVNETLGVHQVTGYEAGASWLTAAQQALYVEDVYVVGRQSTDVYGTFYTANVVVVELNDEYRPNHLDLEQVFIYDFPAVGTWATIEEVSAIRADGSNATIKIDLTVSRTYVEVGSDNRVWTPGLYYLHRTDRTTAEDIWAVERMTHDEIRASGVYDVGTVVSSNFTLPSNYVEVCDWFCGDAIDTIVAGDNHYTDTNRGLMFEGEYTNHTRKDVADSSKYYELSYNNTSNGTIGIGSVTETTATDCLTQRPGGTEDDNRNQVLVRYNDKNEIVYAISFAHGNASVENAAQAVWRSVTLLADDKTVQKVAVLDLRKTAEAEIAGLVATDPDYAAKVANIWAAHDAEKAKIEALRADAGKWVSEDRAAISAAYTAGKAAIEAAGTGAPATYTVTVAAPTNGTASADVTTAAAGATITITATPDTGYKVDTITATDASGAPVTVTGNTFVMPAQNVTVTVTFVVDGGTTPGENDYTANFERSAASRATFDYFNAQLEDVSVPLDVPAAKTVDKNAADKTITLAAGADGIPAWKDVCPVNVSVRVALKIENGTTVVTDDLYLEPEQKVSVEVTSDMTLTFTYTVIKKGTADPEPDYGTGEGGEPADPNDPPEFGVVSPAARSQLLATQTDYVWILMLEGRKPAASTSGEWVQWTEADSVQPDDAVKQNAEEFRAKWSRWNYYLWYLSYTYEDGEWTMPEKPTVEKTSTIVEDKKETYKALADAINAVLADDTKTEAEKEAAKVALQEAIEEVKAAETPEEVKAAEESGTTAIETAKPDPLYEAKKEAITGLTTAASTAKTNNPDNAEAIDKALAEAIAAVNAVTTTEADVNSLRVEWGEKILAMGEVTPAKEVTIAIEGENATANKDVANPGDVVTITAADGYKITSAVVGEETLTISEDGLTATYTVPEDAEGTITITVVTEAVTPANKVTLNLTGTVAMTLPTSVEGTDGTVTFDIVMVNNSYKPVVETVLNANGNETQVWDSENNVVCKLDTSDAEGKTWNVTVSNVADGMTIKFKHEMRIVVSVAKAGTGADGIVSDITPESCFADGTCTFTFDVLSGMTPSVKDYDAESCKYTPTFTKGASNGNGGYTWTLTVTDIESTTAVTITLVTSDEIGVTLTIDETAAGYIDAANTETGYKAIANNTVTFTVKMTRDTVVPQIIDGDGNPVADGVTKTYDEDTGVWTVTITGFGEVEDDLEYKVSATAESAVSIVAGTGVASLSRTKMYPCEAVTVSETSKLIFYVKWENGFKAPTSETITYADGTGEWAGWTKVSIAADATRPVTINGQGAPKATLTIGTGTTSKTAIIFQTGTSMQVEAVYDANSTTTATATFTGIIITDGVNVTVKKATEGEGAATVVSKATVTKQADGTYTVVIPGVTGDGTYILEATGLYYFSVQAASGSGITLPDVNQSAYVTSGNATLTVWVDEGRMPTVDSVAGGSVEASAFSVNYNSAASTAGRSAYDISIPAATLNGANANLTVTLKVSGSKSFAITANLDDTLENGPIWHLGDGMTNLNSSNGVADVVVVMQNGWFPRVIDCDLPAEEGGEDGTSISAQAEGDAECTTAYTYEKGASDSAETEWIIHLTNITTATELTITADKAAEILTQDTAKTADNAFGDGEGSWGGCLKLLATNYAGTNLSIDEEMDANGKHILNITGTICGWMDKTWWDEINAATGSEEEELSALELGADKVSIAAVLPGYWGGQTEVEAAWEWVKNTLIAEGNLAGLTDNSKLGLICFTLPGNSATTMLIHVTDNPAYHGTVNAGESGAAYEVNVNITFDGKRAEFWTSDEAVEDGGGEG